MGNPARVLDKYFDEELGESYVKLTSTRVRADLYHANEGRCGYCGEPLDPFDFHLDHMEPKSRGGEDLVSNLTASCPTCNIKKGSRTVEEFRRALMAEQGIPVFTAEQEWWLEYHHGVCVAKLYEDQYGDMEGVAFWMDELHRRSMREAIALSHEQRKSELTVVKGGLS